jgi:hypothetical protein
VFAAALLPILLWTPHAPSAALELFDGTGTCVTANCQSMLVNGTIFDWQGTAFPWVAQTYADRNQCLRVQVIVQGGDLKATVVGPNGTVWRNNNIGIGSCPTCPLVKLRAPKSGWYTISLAHVLGDPLQTDFTMRIGRYNTGNPNCSNPTPPL